MASFPGGSAWAMARDIGEGYHAVTERTFLRMSRADLDKLTFELNRLLQEVRGNQAPQDDVQALQQRNRKLQRLNSALTVLRAYRMKRKI